MAMQINHNNISKYKEVSLDDIKLLYYCNYWDGMLSGMLAYKDRKHWFSCFDDSIDYRKYDEKTDEFEDLGWYRRFAIIELSDKQIEEQDYWQDLFWTYVNTGSTFGDKHNRPRDESTRYIDRGIPCAWGVRNPKWHHIYYDKRKEKLGERLYNFEYANNKIIGWFHN